jgi:citrate lyase beta subunit
MSLGPTLDAGLLGSIRARLAKVNSEFVRCYPGETPGRQPVHTVYGGAQVFKADTAPKMGALARQSLEDFAPTAADFGRTIGLPEALAPVIYERILEKLEREPVEDYRIDFEDGYGVRPDAEEDSHAASTAREVTAGLAAGTLPPSIGIRIKPFTDEMQARSIRTLDLFVTQLVTAGGRLPANFVVTLAKVTDPEQVAVLAQLLEALEKSLALAAGALRLEIMIETPQSMVNERGEIAVLALVEAGAGRCVAAHFGTYDYTASLSITAAHQHMLHSACDFARHLLQIALAGTGVWLSDGATNIMPIPPHRASGRAPTEAQLSENRRAVHGAWKLHYGHVRHSLAGGYYQGWDLHPAQLPTRYAALYAFFLEGLEAASARLKAFVAGAGQATLVGEVFDDAATGQGLLNFFLRASSCGAITEQEAVEKSGLTVDELRSRSFVRILKGRRG